MVRSLYLIGEEALHNAAKYSEATEVGLRIKQHGGRVRVSVHDNGQGFDPQQARTGNGLENMHRRADAIGAGYTLTAEPGQGTAVTVEKAV